MADPTPPCPACVTHPDGTISCFGWRDPRCKSPAPPGASTVGREGAGYSVAAGEALARAVRRI